MATEQPEEKPASQYGKSTPVTLSPSEQKLLSEAKQYLPCAIDNGLVNAARRHARDIAQSPNSRLNNGMDYLRFALRYSGSLDYAVSPFVFPLTTGGKKKFVRYLQTAPEGFSHCGIGVVANGDEETAVWIASKRNIHLAPFSANPKVNTFFELKGHFINDGIHVDAYLENPEGRVTQISTYVVGQRNFSIPFRLHKKGKYILELMVTGKNGPETALLLPVFVDIPIEQTPTLYPEFDFTEQKPKLALTQLINQIRDRLGLNNLIRHKDLDKVAQAHCKDMVHAEFFGHFSKTTGSLQDRLAHAEVHPTTAAENVAQSGSVMRAHQNLMASPSHKIKIINPQFTHLGLGIAKQGETVVLTQVFANW